MPLYKYKYKRGGEELEETKEFPDKSSLYLAVRTGRGVIISVQEIKKKKSLFSFSFKRGIKVQDQVQFAKNLAVMIDAGLSVTRALSVFQKQSKDKKFIAILESLLNSVNSGETLSRSMEGRSDVFSPLFISMVKAGEESGKLSYSLRVVASQLEKANSLTKKIKGAMIYPAVIVSIMIIIGIILMIYMVPTLTETFKGLNIALPLPTRIIIAISDFLRLNVLATFGILIALGAGIFFGLKSQRGKDFMDWVALHMPMIKGMTREVNAARTARTLSSLISSGVDIVSALTITSEVIQNHYFKALLVESAKQVEVGDLLSATMTAEKGNLYPVFVSEMLAVGEETGKITEMLENISAYYEGEVDQKTKDLSTIIEPFLMVLIGGAVGVFAVAMMLPTYSLVNAIQ